MTTIYWAAHLGNTPKAIGVLPAAIWPAGDHPRLDTAVERELERQLVIILGPGGAGRLIFQHGYSQDLYRYIRYTFSERWYVTVVPSDSTAIAISDFANILKSGMF